MRVWATKKVKLWNGKLVYFSLFRVCVDGLSDTELLTAQLGSRELSESIEATIDSRS